MVRVVHLEGMISPTSAGILEAASRL